MFAYVILHCMSLLPTRVVILPAFLSSFVFHLRHSLLHLPLVFGVCMPGISYACLPLHSFYTGYYPRPLCLDFLFARARDLRCTFDVLTSYLDNEK